MYWMLLRHLGINDSCEWILCQRNGRSPENSTRISQTEDRYIFLSKLSTMPVIDLYILTSSSMLQHLKGKEAKYNKEYHCKDSGRGTYSLHYDFFLELFVLIGEIQMDILLCEQT